LPFDQALSVTFLSESASTTQTLGWLYYDDLITKGYVNTNGTPNDSSDDTLIDSDNDGIPDFHADIFNMGNTRPYIGTTRRCLQKFTHGLISYFMPEIAVDSCTGYFAQETLPSDLSPYSPALSDIVGQNAPVGPYLATGAAFSDNGLYP